MALQKPHYKKKGQCKVINPVARKLFNPTRKKKIDRKPNIKDIASYLYASVPDACAFQYLDMKASSTYPPDDDINVVDTVTIETSTALPRSIPELASATQNIQELLDNLNCFTQDQALFISKTKLYIGASPDGLVTCKCCGSGILEIKCPISVAHLSPSESRLPYLRKDDNDKVNLNHILPFTIMG